MQACARHHSRKNAFPRSSLPTATLPKATLLFSLLLPAVKWMMKIPSCTVPAFILHARLRSALIPRRWLQQIACSKRSQSLFCFHLFFFTFLLYFSPSELASALCSAIQRMKLRIGCGSDGGMANAFFLMSFRGMPNFHEPIHFYPSKPAAQCHPDSFSGE